MVRKRNSERKKTPEMQVYPLEKKLLYVIVSEQFFI